MRLFNAQAGRVEQFQPDEKEISLALCGSTPDENLYLEQAFFYCVADVVVRYLEMKGGDVKVRGGEGWHALEDVYAKSVVEAMKLLNIRPLATAPQTIEAVSKMDGLDLIVLQPDCEIPQGEEVDEKRPFPQVWLQTASVTYKEQRSSDNPVLVTDLLERYSSDTLRIYLAQQHYRRPWVFDDVALKKASNYAGKLAAAMNAVSTGSLPINLEPVKRRFTKGVDKDFDTLKGIASLLNLADEILFRAPNGYLVDEAQEVLQHLASIFGLRLQDEVVDLQAASD